MRDKSHDAKIKELVAQLLDTKRLEAGLSYEDLAKVTGMSTGAIHSVMHGTHNTSPATLDLIAQAVNWSLPELFVEVDVALGRREPTEMVEIRKLLAKPHENKRGGE